MKPKLRVTQTKQPHRSNLADVSHHQGPRARDAPVTSWSSTNTPSFRGAVKKVLHLVTVEEVDHG